MSWTIKEKVPILYDKLNSKYNRIWEQLTNIGLFILASFIAVYITYIQYVTDKSLDITIFLTKVLLILIPLLLIVAVCSAILLTLLISTGFRLYHLLKKYKIGY